jgi:hypothetical protein
MRLVLAAALLAAGSAFAASEAHMGSDWVRVTALPCKDEAVIAFLQKTGQDPADYRAGTADVGRHLYAVCWRPLFEQRMALVIYPDGNQGLIPFSEFRPVKEA